MNCALQRELTTRQTVAEGYLFSACTLHNVRNGLRNTVMRVLGEVGTNEKGEFRMNAMQMIHGAYNIQNYHEIEELKGLWAYVEEADGMKFKVLEEPVLTRWWLVGACAVSFKESIGVWTKICSAIRKSAPSESASLKIASCTLNLIKNKAIQCNLELIAVFHKWFLFPHFKFLQ